MKKKKINCSNCYDSPRINLSIENIAEELCTEAYDLGSGDNVSLVIIRKGAKANPIKISVNKVCHLLFYII